MLHKDFYVWGAGLYGGRLIEFMKEDLTFKAVIDTDVSKCGSVFHGIPIVSYAGVERDLRTSIIVIAINLPTEVRSFLLKEGYIENENFFVIHDFVSWYYWNKKKALVTKTIDIACTTKCNMRCMACQTFIPFSENPIHMSQDRVIGDVDLIFKYIDCTINFNFAIGENLLNDELPEICYKIREQYVGRYRFLSVQTNGTIVPKDDAMLRFSQAEVVLGIANYPENVETTKKLVEKCDKYNVSWYYNRAGGNREYWFNYGDPGIIKDTDSVRLREQYKKCWKPGVGYCDKHLYLCEAQAWSHLVAKTGTLEPGEAFDLRQPKTEASRSELYRLLMKQTKNGYISHCMRCNSVMTSYLPKL